MMKMVLAACLLSVGLATPVLAANATHPYQNCDRKVDQCGPTGDDKVDQLNAQQLGGSGQADPNAPNSGSTMPTSQGTSQ